MAKNSLPLGYLQEALRLDEGTGFLYWREDRPRHHFKNERSYNMYMGKYAGKRAGRYGRSGYRVVGFSWGGKYTHIKVHHIIWRLMTNKKIPDNLQIDHINGDRKDNRPSNLRLVSPRENGKNQKRHKTNTSGFPGVDVKKGRYRARITHKGKQIHLGYFKTAEEAHEVWLEAKRDLGFLEGHGSERASYEQYEWKRSDE